MTIHELVESSISDLTERIVGAVTEVYGSPLAAHIAVELFDAGSVAYEAHQIADIAQPIIAARESLRGYLYQCEADALTDEEADDDAAQAAPSEHQNAESVANAGDLCASV